MNHLNLKKRAMQLAAVLLSLAVLLPSVPAAFASQSAAEGTAVVFSERERGFPALLDAVTELARFRERTDHVQNYPAAQQAYAAALSGLRTADEAYEYSQNLPRSGL